MNEPCQYCGNSNIQRNIQIGVNAEADSIGLEYYTKFVVIGTEAFLADLCLDCGSVVRLFVKNPQQKWVIKK